MEKVPIKVKIGLKKNGHCLYPDFNSLPVVQEAGQDWANYVGQWYYDNKCGHAEVDECSPEGCWCGMLLIPEEFANQAKDKFPDEIEILSEADAEKFYNERHALHFADEDINVKLIEGISLKKSLDIPLTSHQMRAIDPEDEIKGITKNKNKTWKDHTKSRNINIKK